LERTQLAPKIKPDAKSVGEKRVWKRKGGGRGGERIMPQRQHLKRLGPAGGKKNKVQNDKGGKMQG